MYCVLYSECPRFQGIYKHTRTDSNTYVHRCRLRVINMACNSIPKVYSKALQGMQQLTGLNYTD